MSNSGTFSGKVRGKHKRLRVRLNKPESKRVGVKFESDSGAESKCTSENDDNESKSGMRARPTT